MKATRGRKASITDYKNATFRAVKNGEPLPSLDEWLDRARGELSILSIVIKLIDKDDTELTAFVAETDATVVLELIDGSDALEKKYKAGVRMLGAAKLRLLSAMARVHMPDEMTA
jgi:hypothetical protein